MILQRNASGKFQSAILRSCVAGAILFLQGIAPAAALDFDWSGQFRAETHSYSNFTLSASNPVTSDSGGYTIPGGPTNNALFQTLFMRVRPKVIVNDNLVVKSEWWLGDPVFGLFGNALPYSPDQKQFYSNQSRGSVLTAQRYWAEVLTDIGTLQVGRTPLDWGLGIVWNAGEGEFDRYMSTGDAVRMVSKLGAFTFIPGLVTYSLGNSLVGAGATHELTLALRYENLEEDFDAGLNFIRRLGGAAQQAGAGYFGVEGAEGGVVSNTFDIFARKRWGRFSFAAEVPFVDGSIGGLRHTAYAAAVEARWKPIDPVEVELRAGFAPGSPSVAGSPTVFEGYSFHPNYKLGLILFNTQLANFAGPVTLNSATTSASALLSPFDAPVSNAQYARLGGRWTIDKWTLHSQFLLALADDVAKAGQTFYNAWERRFVTNATSVNQDNLIGWEFDLGARLNWDDAFTFGGDVGFFNPGGFYSFSNVEGAPNALGGVFAARVQAGIQF